MEDICAYGLKQPIAIISNGINLPDKKLHFERNDTKKHLLLLGRLHHNKGVALLLKAFAKIKASNCDLADNWHIDLVGWDHENCRIKLLS